MGLNSSSTADLAFDRTPGERLGPPGDGMRIALSTLDGGRIGIAAQAVGIARRRSTSPPPTRRSATRSAARSGASRRSSTSSPTCRPRSRRRARSTWRAARLKEAGRPHTVEGAQAKLFASRVARHWTGEAIQVLGGYGYTKEFPAERYYRDAKVTEIYEGTSEIQRLVIARALLGDRHASVRLTPPSATATPLHRMEREHAPSATRSFTTLSGEPIGRCTPRPTCREPDADRAAGRVSRSRAASTRRCTAGGCGRCASSPGSARRRRPTSASATCSTTGRPGSRRRSTCRR